MSNGKDFPVDPQFEKLIHLVGHKNTKGIAYLLDVPYSTLAELLNPDGKTRFPAGAIPLLIAAAEDNRLIEYLCAVRDLVAVPLPSNNGISKIGLLTHLAGITRETGEASSVLAESLADGVIDQAEKFICLKEIDDAISALAALREDLKAG